MRLMKDATLHFVGVRTIQHEDKIYYMFYVCLFILQDGVGDFDLKKMEENAAKLEKDLIMKELETLDFLEALGSTKRLLKT